jgi:hypothetical protein
VGTHLSVSQLCNIHRSAKDFLDQPKIWSDILAKTSRSGFDVKVSLMNSYLLHLKAWSPKDPADYILPKGLFSSSEIRFLGPLVERTRDFARFSKMSRQNQDRVLDEVDRVVQYHTNLAAADALREHPEGQIVISKTLDPK